MRSLLSFHPKRWLCAATILLCSTASPVAAQQNPDTEQLGRALEYFSSAKYHEALLIFHKLDESYNLNFRFKAYIGLCYYQEWDFKNAVKYIGSVKDKLSTLNPHEQNVYYFAAAESFFQLEKYDDALPYYQLCLKNCFDAEKGDIYYRIGMIHMMAERWVEAIDAYVQADNYLAVLRNPEQVKAKRAQTRNMMRGCQEKLRKEMGLTSNKY